MIQIDIPMPQSCFDCFTSTTNILDNLYCAIKSQKETKDFHTVSDSACVEKYLNTNSKPKPDWCPLVEVVDAQFTKRVKTTRCETNRDSPWCQIEPEVLNYKPHDLKLCREKCQNCPVSDNCVRWYDLSKR